MAFFARYGDTSVRQLLLGNAHPLVHMRSVEFQTAVQNSFGLPLKVLEGHIGERIRNHANCAQLAVDKYVIRGQNLIPSVLQRGTRTSSTLCVRVRVVTCSTPRVKHGEQVAQDKQVTGGGGEEDGT